MRLQLLPGDGIRGMSSHGLHERVHVRSCEPKHRKVTAVVGISDSGFLELDLDPSEHDLGGT